MGLIKKAILVGGVASLLKMGSDSKEKREEKKHQLQLEQQQQGYGLPQGPYECHQYSRNQNSSQSIPDAQPPRYQQQPYYPGAYQDPAQVRSVAHEQNMGYHDVKN